MALPTTQRRPQLHHLPATPETVHWGYFDGTLTPRLTIRSGDIVELEMLTHRAGDAPDLLMDDGVRRVYQEVGDRGPGPHIMTGPIAVEGAGPGDTLEVRVLGMHPHTHQAKAIAMVMLHRATVDRCWDAFSADSSDTPPRGSA
jgi:acetamidase/formamidase